MKKHKIMAIDDKESQIENIKSCLSGYNFTGISNPFFALDELKNNFYDIVMIDYSLPYLSGLELLIEAKKYNSYNYGILFANEAEKKLLENSLNKPLVSKCIGKPIDYEILKNSIDDAIHECDTLRNYYLRLRYQKLFQEFTKNENMIIGIDKGLKDIYENVKLVANLPVNVLITGETGSGKELIAHEIHNLSERRNCPFIKINCSAIPDTLFESELFGVVKGAFTGANNNVGKIELANGGTLFLDEIGEMKPELQAKLLRVLQTKEFERLGCNKTIRVDFRLITATNKSLKKLIANKFFRQDLFYRINEFQIHLPPLRGRKEDIKDLLLFFIKKNFIELNLSIPLVSKEVISLLQGYQWLGNIREFENTVKRVLITLKDSKIILPEHFSFILDNSKNIKNHESEYQKSLDIITSVIIDKKIDLKDIEKELLDKVLKIFNNNVSEAVKRSGISKNKFYRKKKA